MKFDKLLNALAALSGLIVATATAAASDIPAESGWSGHVALGAGAGQAETNLIDGIGPVEMGDNRTGGLGEDAGSQSFGFPVLRFDVAYTLAETGTQFYARSQPSPHIFLDLETHAGIRQKLEGVGIVNAALTASAPVTKVWKDPYLSGANRGDTERSASGLSMGWHAAMDTPLSIEISSQDIEIDDEQSGASLALAPAERRLLRRTGQVYRYHLEYEWALNGRHILVPAVSYLDYDLDGDAMAEDGWAFQLSHEYLGGKWRFLSSLFYHDLEAGEENPIFGEASDREVFGVGLTAFYAKPFGLKSWEANARVSWYESDSDIDFYDESLGLVMVGATYRLK